MFVCIVIYIRNQSEHFQAYDTSNARKFLKNALSENCRGQYRMWSTSVPGQKIVPTLKRHGRLSYSTKLTNSLGTAGPPSQSGRDTAQNVSVFYYHQYQQHLNIISSKTIERGWGSLFVQIIQLWNITNWHEIYEDLHDRICKPKTLYTKNQSLQPVNKQLWVRPIPDLFPGSSKR